MEQVPDALSSMMFCSESHVMLSKEQIDWIVALAFPENSGLHSWHESSSWQHCSKMAESCSVELADRTAFTLYNIVYIK